MNWLRRVLSAAITHDARVVEAAPKPTPAPLNKLVVDELIPPYPQRDVPSFRRRVFACRATDPTAPLVKIDEGDGIPRLWTEYPHPYPPHASGHKLLAGRIRVEPVPGDTGAFYLVVDYSYMPDRDTTEPSKKT